MYYFVIAEGGYWLLGCLKSCKPVKAMVWFVSKPALCVSLWSCHCGKQTQYGMRVYRLGMDTHTDHFDTVVNSVHSKLCIFAQKAFDV